MLAALYGLAVAASPAVSFVDELDVAPKLKPRQLSYTFCPVSYTHLTLPTTPYV